jgi:hypothetical protein
MARPLRHMVDAEDTFRSYVLKVMSLARFPCATPALVVLCFDVA